MYKRRKKQIKAARHGKRKALKAQRRKPIREYHLEIYRLAGEGKLDFD